MKFAPRPVRTLRQEATFALLVLSIPAAAAMIFPYGAFSFAPREAASEEGAKFAFVSLAADEERAVLSSVRSAWHARIGGRVALRADLSMDLPPIDGELRISPSMARAMPAAVRSAVHLPALLPPTAGAEEPAAIIREDAPAQAQGDAFPREELMALPEIKGGLR